MDVEGTWSIEPIRKHHERNGFDCGFAELDEFLRKYARQNEELGLSRTFVAVSPGTTRVLGYFTLRTGEIALDDLPEEVRRRLPRYPVPVVHLGRLAVDRTARGLGLGGQLLLEALSKALRVADQVGALAVEVIAIDDAARAFYEHHGFRPLRDDPRHLYLSMKTVARLFS